MRNNIALWLAWIVGIAIFGGWMSIVGNPHVAETSIGLVMAIVAGLWVYFKIRKGK